MVNATASLRAGAAGLSCIQGNIYPELIVWLCNHYNDSEREEDVVRLQNFFDESMELVHTAYPIIAKYSLQKKRVSDIVVYQKRSGCTYYGFTAKDGSVTGRNRRPPE